MKRTQLALSALILTTLAAAPALATDGKHAKKDPSSYGHTAPNRAIDPKNDNYNANRGNGGNDNINRSDSDNSPSGPNNSAPTRSTSESR